MKKGRPPIKVKRPLAYTLLNFIYKASLPLLCHILLVSQCYLSIRKRRYRTFAPRIFVLIIFQIFSLAFIHKFSVSSIAQKPGFRLCIFCRMCEKRKNPAAQRPDSFFLYKYKTHFFLVMEQTDSCKCHRHVVLVAALDDSVVTNRSARLCDVLDAALVCALDVVAEREEGIGA